MSDVYWDQTACLLRLTGVNGSVYFPDAAYRSVVGANGNVQVSTAQSPFDGSSAYFDGAGSYLNLSKPAQLALGTSDFCIEFFVRQNSPAAATLIDFRPLSTDGAYPTIEVDASGFVTYKTGSTVRITATTALTAGQFTHVAVSRTAGVTKLFITGTQSGSSFTDTTNYIVGASRPVIGCSGHTLASTNFNGHLASLRITNGQSRYTTTFTPTTAAFEGGLVQLADTLPDYFDQTVCRIPLDGDYWYDQRHRAITAIGTPVMDPAQKLFGTKALRTTVSTGLATTGLSVPDPTADYTFEVFLRLSAYPTSTSPFATGFFNGEIQLGSAGNITVYSNADGSILLAPTAKIPLNKWCHLAVSKDTVGMKMYLDGVRIAEYTGIRDDITSGQTFSIGELPGSFQAFRATLGVARYTDRFVPPTKQFAAPATYDQHYDKVVLHLPLTGENNTYTVVDLKGHPITADSTDLTLLPKIVTSTTALTMIGGACLLITNDVSPHLTAISPDFNVGTADFCFEFFVGYYGYSTGDETLFGLRNGTDTGWAFRVTRISISAVTEVYINDVLVMSTSLTYPGYGAAQRHIAISRSGGVIRLFSAGTVSTSTYASAADLTGNGRIYIFGYPATVSAGGYYNQVRYTIGDGRYTTNFTPPTDPFPEYALQKLTGTVFDAVGNPVAKTVRSYRTSDGLFVDQSVSNATTGAFELRATDTTEHFVVVHDATKNALVYDHIVPVI